jgi:hypothetical protein
MADVASWVDKFHAMNPDLELCKDGVTLQGFKSKRTKFLEAKAEQEANEAKAKMEQVTASLVLQAQHDAEKDAASAAAAKNILDHRLAQVESVRSMQQFYDQREELKATAFRMAKEQLEATAASANYPPYRAFTPDVRFSKLRSVTPPLQLPLKDPVFVYADITTDTLVEDGLWDLKLLRMEVSAIRVTQGKTATFAIRCLPDQVLAVYKMFGGFQNTFFADAAFVIGSTFSSLTKQSLDMRYDLAKEAEYLHPHHKSGSLGGLVSGYILTFCETDEQLKSLQRKAMASMTIKPPEAQDFVVKGLLKLFRDATSTHRNFGYIDPYMFKPHLSHEDWKYWGAEFPEWMAVLWYFVTRGVTDASSHIWTIGGNYDVVTTATSILGATIVVFPNFSSAPLPIAAACDSTTPDYVVSTSRTAVSANLIGTTILLLL